MTENKRLFVGRKTCEDRFTIITDYNDEIGVKENRSGDVLVLKHSDLNAQQFVAQLVVFLNDQNQAIVDLFDGSKYWSDKASEKIDDLEEENEQLKQAYTQLKHRHSLLHDDCLDAECGRDRYYKDVLSLEKENEQLKKENRDYKSLFFELVETALTDKNCRELYCKGILDIFDKANSLNQAREMIKEYLE